MAKKSKIIDDQISRWISVVCLTGVILILLLVAQSYINEFPKFSPNYLIPISFVLAFIVSRIRIVRIGILEILFSDFTERVWGVVAVVLTALLGIGLIAVYFEIDFLLRAFDAVFRFFEKFSNNDAKH